MKASARDKFGKKGPSTKLKRRRTLIADAISDAIMESVDKAAL